MTRLQASWIGSDRRTICAHSGGHFSFTPSEVLSFANDLDSRDRPLTAFGKNMMVCSWMGVSYFVAYVMPVGGKWHLTFGDTPIQNITHWMPLPELPQGSVAV